MDRYSERLLTVSDEVAASWIERLIDRIAVGSALRIDDEWRRIVVTESTTALHRELTRLLAVDAAEQSTNPLSVFRRTTAIVTAHLLDLGAAPVERDEFHVRSFPDDVLGLCPATWADIDERLVEPGLEWGAWKAATIIARRRAD